MANVITALSLGTYGFFTDTGGTDVVPTGEEMYTLGFFNSYESTGVVVPPAPGMPPQGIGRGFLKTYQTLRGKW